MFSHVLAFAVVDVQAAGALAQHKNLGQAVSRQVFHHDRHAIFREAHLFGLVGQLALVVPD